jgi:hypothetical protein
MSSKAAMRFNYDSMAEETFQKMLTKYTSSLKTPLAMFTIGIPASGKSSSVKYVLDTMGISNTAIVLLDPDEVMSEFPGYNNSLRGNTLREFNKAGVIVAKKIFDKLVEAKISFVYFGTGKGFSFYRGLLSKTNKAGYKNGLINVMLNSDEAINRNSKRARSVGPSVIKNISASLKSGLTAPKYARGKTPYEALRDLDFVNFVYDVDTSLNPPLIEMAKSNRNNSVQGKKRKSRRLRSKKRRKGAAKNN